MVLPNVENAFIDDRKLIDYCLSETHPVGKHKARVFMSALSFSLENFQDLKKSKYSLLNSLYYCCHVERSETSDFEDTKPDASLRSA